MYRRTLTTACALLAAFGLAGCANSPLGQGAVTLIDGDKGKGGYLVTKSSDTDFAIYAEF